MTTQRVLTQAMNLFNDGKASTAKAKAGGSKDLSFGTIMSRNAGSQKTEPSKNEVQLSSEKDNIPVDYDVATAKDKNAVSVSNPKINETSAEEDAIVAPDKETGVVTPEEMAEAMSQMQTAIIKQVTQALGISEKELSSYLEELDIKPLDLLKPSNVMQLVMKANALEEPMQVLTDENLSAQLKELTANLEQVKPASDFGISREEVMEALEKLPQEVDFAGVMKNAAKDLQSEKLPKAGPTIMVDQDAKSVDTKNSDAKSMDGGKTTVTAVTTESLQETAEKETSRETGGRGGSREGRGQEQQTPAQVFAENLAVKGQTETMGVKATAERVQLMQNIVEQVVEQIKVQIKPQATSMEIQLNPENLGKINLSVASKDGQLTATITAQTQIAKEALESQIQILRENLNNQGLKVEAVEVTVSNFDFNRNTGDQMTNNQDQKKNQSGRRKIDLSTFDEQIEDATEEEILAADIMKQNGGSVDYTA